MLFLRHSHSLNACHSTPLPSSALPSLSRRIRARTLSLSSVHAAHCRPSPSLSTTATKPTLHAYYSTMTQPFISQYGSTSCLSTSTAIPRCALISSSSGSSCLFRHGSSTISRSERYDALVPNAGGRSSGPGFETYDLSGKGQQQQGKGGLPSPQGRGRGGGRGGKRGRGSLPSPSSPEDRVPSLGTCLADIQRLQSNPQLKANPAAYCLYNLSKRVSVETRAGAQLSSECRSILAAADTVAHLLLEPRSTTSVPLVMQLEHNRLSQLSWATSALKEFDMRAMSPPVRQLCYALAGRASQPGVMDVNKAEACRSWAGVLHGLGEAGVKCGDNIRVQQVFRFALEVQLPDLLRTGQKCISQDVSMIAMACVDAEFKGSMEPFISAVADKLRKQGPSNVMFAARPQAWSNLIYACGKLVDRVGGSGKALGEGAGVIMSEGAAAMARAVRPRAHIQPTSQHLSNTLWGLAHFDWYDAGVIRELADAFVHRISSSTPQAVANVLWALANLGWYDSAVYNELLRGLMRSTKQMNALDMSNALYSCAMVSHFGAAVDALACVVSKQDLSDWNEQEVSNALYAWAVLSLLDKASADLNGMASALFIEANSRGTAAFSNPLQTRQLYTAHMEAESMGLQGGGLSTGNGLQQTAAKDFKGYLAGLRGKKQSGGSAAVKQAMAALQQAGYEVEQGAGVGEDGFAVDLLVRHESCPSGFFVDVVTDGAFFRHPRGLLSGKVAAVHAQIRHRCDGLVVLSEAEARQPAVVVGAVQRELARVAGQ